MARQGKDMNADVIKLVRQMQALIPLLADLQQTGIIDGSNSTDETLGAGGTFTGAWTLVGDRVQAAISVTVTAASAADGLVFEHSADGATAIHSHSYALGAGQSRHFDEPLLMDFFRIRYTDGGVGGDLVMQTKLYKTPPTSHAHALSESFNAEHGANIVRSVLSGFDAVGGLSKNVSSYETVAGIVALLGLLVDPSGTALRFYIEDDAKAGNAVGIAPMAVRQDTLVTLTPPDGDWSPWKVNDVGALWVAVSDPVTVTGAVTSANKSGTSALTDVAASASSVTILSANAARNYAMIHNDSVSATLKLKYGATASATSFTGQPIRPGQSAFIDDGYTGRIDGIWDAAVGTARITELSA